MPIVGGLMGLLYRTDPCRFFLSQERMMSFLDSLGPWGFAGFVSLQALQVIVSPIPGDVTGLLGGYLYGPFKGIVLSTVGLVIGSYAAFALSRYYGKPFVEKFVPRSALERFGCLLDHKGAFLVFFLFFIPGFPKDYLCYILGLGNLSTTQFIVMGGAGRLFGTILLTLGGNYIRLHQYYRFSVLAAVAIVAVLLAMACREKLEILLKSWLVDESKAGESSSLG